MAFFNPFRDWKQAEIEVLSSKAEEFRIRHKQFIEPY
jgi:hypothetical protein